MRLLLIFNSQLHWSRFSTLVWIASLFVANSTSVQAQTSTAPNWLHKAKVGSIEYFTFAYDRSIYTRNLDGSNEKAY